MFVFSNENKTLKRTQKILKALTQKNEPIKTTDDVATKPSLSNSDSMLPLAGEPAAFTRTALLDNDDDDAAAVVVVVGNAAAVTAAEDAGADVAAIFIRSVGCTGETLQPCCLRSHSGTTLHREDTFAFP